MRLWWPDLPRDAPDELADFYRASQDEDVVPGGFAIPEQKELTPAQQSLLQLCQAAHHLKQGAFAEALEVYLSLEGTPHHVFAQFNGAQVSLEQGHKELAKTQLEDLLENEPTLNPEQATEVHLSLAYIASTNYCFYQQTAHFKSCFELQPHNPRYLKSLFLHIFHSAMVHELPKWFAWVTLKLPEAQKWFGNLTPEAQKYHQDHLYYYHSRLILYFYSQYTLKDPELFQQLKIWDRLYTSALRQAPTEAKAASKIKVGYVSKELDLHSPVKVFGPLLANHDHDQFEIHAFSDTPVADKVTQKLKTYFDVWHDTATLTGPEIFELIREQGIHILVDLGGFTHRDRLLVFAMKPAPIQVTGLGFIFPTGLAAMDYVLTDRVLSPPEQSALWVEQPAYLQSVFHWEPDHPYELTLPPVIQNGFITLGSSNTLNKMCPDVFDLWSRLMLQIPDARLCLKTPSLDDPENARWVLAEFEKRGITRERVTLYGARANAEQNQAHSPFFYSQIDLALDTFPYTGAITTCDALWMGVPVVTLYELDISSRALSSSILYTLGLHEWIASSFEHYLEICEHVSRSPERLIDLRFKLREYLRSSVICDGAQFARDVEGAYQNMWQRYRERVISR